MSRPGAILDVHGDAVVLSSNGECRSGESVLPGEAALEAEAIMGSGRIQDLVSSRMDYLACITLLALPCLQGFWTP